MITLPTQPTEFQGVLEPSKLLIFGQPKIGKSELALALPNSLLVDLERGSKFYKGVKIDVKDEAAKSGTHPVKYYFELAATIQKANQDAGKKVYDFIIMDTLSVLEEMSDELAVSDYKKSAMGKSYVGTNLNRDLQNGAGYLWTRIAFEKLYKVFDGLAGKCLILLGHVKTASITKKGDTLTAKDISVTGKLKTVLTSDMDASGYMYREKSSNKNILSFLTEEQDLVSGTRIPALSGKEIVISEKIDGKLVTHWDLIFPSLKEQK